MQTIKVLVDAGKANAGPPLGPALGPLGIDTMKVVEEINSKTKDMIGMQLPIIISVDSVKKTFTVEVGAPLTSALIKKELNLKKAVGNVKSEVSGNLTFEQLLKITKAKYPQLISKSIKSGLKEVSGTCRSMGVKIDDLSVEEFITKLNDGFYDKKIS